MIYRSEETVLFPTFHIWVTMLCLSGVSSRLHQVGSGLRRVLKVCDLSMRKSKDKQELKFDRVFEM